MPTTARRFGGRGGFAATHVLHYDFHRAAGVGREQWRGVRRLCGGAETPLHASASSTLGTAARAALDYRVDAARPRGGSARHSLGSRGVRDSLATTTWHTLWCAPLDMTAKPGSARTQEGLPRRSVATGRIMYALKTA